MIRHTNDNVRAPTTEREMFNAKRLQQAKGCSWDEALRLARAPAPPRRPWPFMVRKEK